MLRNDRYSNSQASVSLGLATPVQRLFALGIDLLVGVAVGFIPLVGVLLAPIYFLTRDSLPFLDGRSVGKKMMGLQVLDKNTLQPITEQYDKSILRAITLCIPVFQFLDAFMVLSSRRQRFGDIWAKTMVYSIEK